MGMPPGLPPGLPPNFRQLPPHVQQQLFMQLQQRAAAAAAKSAPPPQQQQSMPPAPIQTRVPPTPGQGGVGIPNNTPSPYTVNNVIHNRAIAEVNGVHIRDLPISAAGLPCLPSGASLPPNVLFKLHHDELLNMDAVLNEHSNKIQMLLNRVDNGVGAAGSAYTGPGSLSYTGNDNSSRNITDYDSLVNNTAFITKLLDNILTNTNLSDIINQIEPLQKENESLRALLNSQQTTLNELSGLVMKLLANGLPSYSSYSNNETNETSENIENIENRVYDSYDNTLMNGASSVYNPTTVYDANNINDGCTLTVTELHNLPDGEENEDEEEEEEDEGEDATDENQEEGQHVDS
jgi:hypothetical protein